MSNLTDENELVQLDKLRKKLLKYVDSKHKLTVIEMLDEMNTLYFDWIERVMNDAETSAEVEKQKRIQRTDNNLIKVDFKKQ
jgi:hypothetical protein